MSDEDRIRREDYCSHGSGRRTRTEIITYEPRDVARHLESCEICAQTQSEPQSLAMSWREFRVEYAMYFAKIQLIQKSQEEDAVDGTLAANPSKLH